MRKLQIKLTEVFHDGKKLEGPVLSLNGTGSRTFLWVGDKSGCYSFTGQNVEDLHRLAQSILNRLSK